MVEDLSYATTRKMLGNILQKCKHCCKYVKDKKKASTIKISLTNRIIIFSFRKIDTESNNYNQRNTKHHSVSERNHFRLDVKIFVIVMFLE